MRTVVVDHLYQRLQNHLYQRLQTGRLERLAVPAIGEVAGGERVLAQAMPVLKQQQILGQVLRVDIALLDQRMLARQRRCNICPLYGICDTQWLNQEMVSTLGLNDFGISSTGNGSTLGLLQCYRLSASGPADYPI